MNLSLNSKTTLFASFSASFKAASWPTLQSMSFEAALKFAKKHIKEAIAKLHDSEKSMILGSLERQSKALPSRADGGLPRRAGEEARSQESPKGRFLASKSFVIASNNQYFRIKG